MGIDHVIRTVVVGGDDVFTIDEAVFSREIAPLAGFYPSVLGEAEAIEVMHDLVVTNPRRAFKL
jgi:hypothetical protein